jgi:hypothetical protein
MEDAKEYGSERTLVQLAEPMDLFVISIDCGFWPLPIKFRCRPNCRERVEEG